MKGKIKIKRYKKNTYAINKKEGFITLIHPTKKLTIRCNKEDKFDEEFGLQLAHARFTDNKRLENKLFKEKYGEKVCKFKMLETEKIKHKPNEIFGVRIPYNETSLSNNITITLKNNKLIYEISNAMIHPQTAIGEVEIDKNVKYGDIAKAEVKAKKDLYSKIENMIC